MKVKMVCSLVLSFLALVMFGCGGGGSGGAGGTTVSGTAAKGLINGGTVQVFEIISSQNSAKARIGTTALGQGTTAADGSYAVNIGSTMKKGGLLVKVTGGTYKDEATGATRNLSSQAATGLRAAFGNISGAVRRGTGVVVNVTPFTELGVEALADPVHPTDASIGTANALVSATFPALNSVNILTTKPIDVTAAPPAGTTAAQLNYSVALATVSELQASSSLTLDQLALLYLPDVQAGALTAPHTTAVTIAELNFLSSANNKTGASMPGTAVTVTPSATAANINASVTITANATLSGNPVPDGTIVTFTVKSGTGTLTNVTTTTGGVATATLTSAVDGTSVVVTANAGGVSNDAAAVTFTDPNRPTTVTVTANPTTVTAGSPVTISATVTRLAGGAVPDGTAVTFAVTSGTGTLSNETTTTGGVATATLTSTVGGTVVVKATAGAVSNTVSVTFNAPPTQHTLAIVKVQTTGTLPAGKLIGGIVTTVTYPTTGLTIAGTDVVASAAGTTAGTLFTSNTATAGQVSLILVNVTPGIQAGEFATLTFHIGTGTFPVAGDFAILDPTAGIVDTTGTAILGMSFTIKSVTFQ